jgi:parvulin-like peptidyl-prolyl isomerase
MILILSSLLLYPAWTASAQTNEDIIVLVNETPIRRQDLQMEADLLDAEMRRRNRILSKHQKAKLSRQLVENLIERELFYQSAQQKKIEIRNRWVDRAIADLKADLKSASGFKAYLKNAHMNEKQLRARIQKGLVVRRLLRREVLRQIKVSEAEMQAFYRENPDFFQRKEQVRIRQILIAVDMQDDTSNRGDALLRIQAIQKKLNEGGNFAALAIEYSEDKSSAVGGDLGYLQRNQMVDTFADAAYSLQIGEISDIIETRIGYHLIQMVDRIPPSQMPYREARTKIERTLRRDKEKKATNAYLAKLKRRASIKRMIQ